MALKGNNCLVTFDMSDNESLSDKAKVSIVQCLARGQQHIKTSMASYLHSVSTLFYAEY